MYRTGWTLLMVSFFTFAGTSAWAKLAQKYLDAKHPPNSEWGYPLQKGKLLPDKWYQVKTKGHPEGFPTCRLNIRKNEHQSPINIKSEQAKVSGKSQLKFDYKKTDFYVYHNRHTIEFDVFSKNSKNTLWIGNEAYILRQFHYHIPSEHLFNGKTKDFEIHFVHASKKGKLAVLGVMGEIISTPTGAIAGSPFNQEIIRILNHYKGKDEPDVKVKVSNVDLNNFLPLKGSRAYFTYQGSLTTPPCSEIVTWVVFSKPVRLTQQQVKLIRLFNFDIGFKNARRHKSLPAPHVPKYNRKYHQLQLREDISKTD